MSENKENSQLNLNTQDLQKAIEDEGLIVYKKSDEDKRQVSIESGEESYFTMLAMEMLELSDKYKRDVDEIHKMFF